METTAMGTWDERKISEKSSTISRCSPSSDESDDDSSLPPPPPPPPAPELLPPPPLAEEEAEPCALCIEQRGVVWSCVVCEAGRDKEAHLHTPTHITIHPQTTKRKKE